MLQSKPGIFSPTLSGKAKTFFIEQIWPEVFKDSIKLSEMYFHPGAVRFEELLFIAAISKFLNPKKVFEIGTCRGRTTLNIAENILNLEKLYTLNLPPEWEMTDSTWLDQDFLLYKDSQKHIGSYFQKYPIKEKIIQLFGDSTKFDFSSFQNIDLVFIDASKHEDYVYSDSKNAYNMLSENGTIIWHDYNYADGVTKGVDRFASEKNLNLINIYKTTLCIYSKNLNLTK